MVVIDYNNLDSIYEEVKQSACGRQACSVMIIIANEVDAMASARILTQLLRSDSIAYKLRPIANFSHVLQTIDEFKSMDIKTVFMINCGSIYNLPKLFELNQGTVRIILLDNHRPLHLANVHSRYNVVVLDDGSISTDEIPSDGSDLSSQEDSDEEFDSDDDNDEDENKFKNIDKLVHEELSDNEDEEENDNDNENEFNDDQDQDQNDDDDIEKDEQEDDIKSNDNQLEENSNLNINSIEGEENNNEINNENENNEDNDSDNNIHNNNNNNNKEKEIETMNDNKGNDDNEEEEDEEEDDDDVIIGKKRKGLSEKYDPSKHRRKKLRMYYSRGDSYAAPTSVMLINLVKNLNKSCSSDIIWNAILGATDQYLRHHISELLYVAICEELRREITQGNNFQKYTIGSGNQEIVIPGAEAGFICPGWEYRFFMYRHWSIYESMWNSSYIASKMSVWKTQGTMKLQEMLAKMGIPLQQCKQSYNYMTPTLRNHFRQQIVGDVAKEYGLNNPPVIYKSFFRYNSFKNPIAAADIVYAVTALIEMGGDENSDLISKTNDELSSENQNDENGKLEIENNEPNWINYFNQGYDCLGMKPSTESTLKNAIQIAISLQKAIVSQAAIMLERHDAIIRLKCFRYSLISRSSGGSNDIGHHKENILPDSIFGRPAVISKLAHFLLTVQTENGSWSGKKAKPLILAAEKKDTYIVVGVTPLNVSSSQHGLIPKNNFRQLFALAAEETRARIRNDGIDTSIIEIDKDDIHPFIENLMFLMTS